MADTTQGKGLKKNAIGYASSVVIGVASTAPGYSLAAVLGLIVAIAGIGVHAPAVLLDHPQRFRRARRKTRLLEDLCDDDCTAVGMQCDFGHFIGQRALAKTRFELGERLLGRSAAVEARSWRGRTRPRRVSRVPERMPRAHIRLRTPPRASSELSVWQLAPDARPAVTSPRA